MTKPQEHEYVSLAAYTRTLEEYCAELESNQVLSASARQFKEMDERLEAAERDAARWHEYLAKKKVLADRGFGKAPMRNEAMKENKQ